MSNRVRNRTDLDGSDRSIGCNESFSWENPSNWAGFCNIAGPPDETVPNGLMQSVTVDERPAAFAALQGQTGGWPGGSTRSGRALEIGGVTPIQATECGIEA